MPTYNIEKMHKLPPAARFLDVNELWYFTNRWVVPRLCPLPVSANHITFLSLAFGLVSAFFFLSETPHALAWAAIFLYGKIFLDNVDGNLARIRGEESRLGRFLDSLTDFVVTVAVYMAIAARLVEETGEAGYWFLGTAALLSALLHCSHFVFYLVCYTSRLGVYQKNRTRENITERDQENLRAGKVPARDHALQRIHLVLYGWQDSLIEKLDRMSRNLSGVAPDDRRFEAWYTDKKFLTLASPLCLCTNNMILVICALVDQLESGLFLILIAGNLYLFAIQTWKILRFRWGSV